MLLLLVYSTLRLGYAGCEHSLMSSYDPQRVARNPDGKLSPAELRFCEEMLEDLDASAAAIRSGYPPEYGNKLLATRRVTRCLGRLRAKRATRVEVTADHLVRTYDAARRVDFNAFVSMILSCCRWCWGIDHKYQFTAAELELEQAKHREKMIQLPEERRIPFDDPGGDGYDRFRLPCFSPERAPMLGIEAEHATSDHNCPECGGGGEQVLGENPLVLWRDTRFLSPAARYVYEGIEVAANGGFKYKLRQRADFEEKLERHLGMISRGAGSNASQKPRRFEEMTSEELARLAQANGISVDTAYETELLAAPPEDNNNITDAVVVDEEP